MPEVYYLDTSVAIHVLVGTPTAVAWFDARVDDGDRLVSSRLLGVELARFLHREGLDPTEADFLHDSLHLLSVDDALLVEAARVPAVLQTLDCLHLASADRVGRTMLTIATHDKAMRAAAESMGFSAVDPVA